MMRMKQIITLLACFALAGCSSARDQQVAPEVPADGSDVEISGTVEFKSKVAQALTLLRDKAPEAYGVVTKYVGKVAQGRRSGMWVQKNPPTYEMADKTTFYSVSWCASTIAHDSFHSKLYHEYKQGHPGPVPDNVWTGEEAERQCLEHQLAVLKKIGAPKDEIDYCSKLDGTHHDVNQDGEYDWEDYRKRNW